MDVTKPLLVGKCRLLLQGLDDRLGEGAAGVAISRRDNQAVPLDGRAGAGGTKLLLQPRAGLGRFVRANTATSCDSQREERRSTMQLDKLAEIASMHYTDREFPPAAVLHLEKVIRDESVVRPDPGGDVLEQVGKRKLRQPVKIANAIGNFPPNAQPVRSLEGLREAEAIFAFSFGYRVKSRPAPGQEVRLPGLNNRALAVISAQLKSILGVPLFAQFEISDALDDYTDVVADFSSPAEDLGTTGVIKSFVSRVEGKSVGKVVVVAHQHHLARCALVLLNDFNIESVPAVETYCGYDPREAQPHVVSPEEYIVHDFVVMALHRAWDRLPT